MLSARAHLPKTRAGWLIGSASLLIVLVVAILLLMPRGAPQSLLDVSALPRINAMLNAASALLLSTAYLSIQRRRVRAHRLCMLSALSLSALFLMSYVVYHAVAGSARFTGPDHIRPIYQAILISHAVLAILVLPLALTTLHRGLRGVYVQHKRIARWTLPIWLYVSVSGVLVYFMLYHFWN
jgi:putative membrane protein